MPPTSTATSSARRSASRVHGEGARRDRGGLEQAPSPRVVRVHHRGPRVRGREQPRLRAEVGVHRRVVVEMILGEVREGRHVEHHAAHAMLVERVGGDLHRHGLDPVPPHPGEQPVQVGGLGRGAGERHGCSRHAGPRRPDHAGRHAGRLEDRLQQIGRGGLAVGAGHAHHRHGSGGMAEDRRGHRPHRLAHRRHEDLRPIDPVEPALHDEGAGAGLRRGGREVVPVDALRRGRRRRDSPAWPRANRTPRRSRRARRRLSARHRARRPPRRTARLGEAREPPGPSLPAHGAAGSEGSWRRRGRGWQRERRVRPGSPGAGSRTGRSPRRAAPPRRPRTRCAARRSRPRSRDAGDPPAGSRRTRPCSGRCSGRSRRSCGRCPSCRPPDSRGSAPRRPCRPGRPRRASARASARSRDSTTSCDGEGGAAWKTPSGPSLPRTSLGSTHRPPFAIVA